jgi:glyoxylase-like metal-dependent hydrolase (beta-lactamase superfamily II)/rhodanese-related sulfurtransferase
MRLDSEQREISAGDLREMLERGEPVTVLDIRRSPDRAEWSIPGSVSLDVYDAVAEGDVSGLARFRPPAGRPVVTVCYRGNVSLLAAAHLRGQGVPALSLRGGMGSWSLMWNTAVVPLPGVDAEVVQLRRTGKGCLSYLVGSGGVAAVIDPAVAPEVLIELAGARGWTIAHVLDTHVHADHLSRARALASQTGATLHLPAQDRVRFPFAPVRDGDRIAVGAVSLQAMHTPGHTLESTCYLLADRALFSGDTIFLTSIGRPDLAAAADEETRRRAGHLYRSLQRLTALPPDTMVLPGHAPEPVPFDGRPLWAPLGEALRRAALPQLPENEFVEAVLARIPAPPANHLRIVRLNEAGELPRDPRDLEVGANRCAIG